MRIYSFFPDNFLASCGFLFKINTKDFGNYCRIAAVYLQIADVRSLVWRQRDMDVNIFGMTFFLHFFYLQDSRLDMMNTLTDEISVSISLSLHFFHCCSLS